MFYVRIPPLDLKASPPRLAFRYKFHGRVFEAGAQSGRWYGPYKASDAEGFRDQKVNASPVFEVVAADACVGERGGPTAEVLKDQTKTAKAVKETPKKVVRRRGKAKTPKKAAKGGGMTADAGAGKDGRSSEAGKGA